MIEDRVGELRLRIRTDVPDAVELRSAAERLIGRALERSAALLEARMPGRIALVRRLPLRWQVAEDRLGEAEEIDELARTVADTVERMARPATVEPPPEAEAVLFDDEAQLRASHLLARARGRPAWFHQALEESSAGDPLAFLAVPERRDMAEATLIRLARENRLAEVLAAQPPAAVEVLAAALGCGPGPASPDPARRIDGAPPVPAAGNGVPVEPAALAPDWPPLSPAARSLALRVHAAARLGTAIGAPLAAAGERPAIPAFPDAEAMRPPEHGAPFPGPASPERPRPRRGNRAEDAELAETGGFVATRYAGLFYLCDRIQELGLGESLWRACLPEGIVLAAALAALPAPDHADDPAPRILGGVDRVPRCPGVTAEQLEEVADATVRALAAALPRRGLAGIPPVRAAFGEHPAGRLLVAAAEGSPFAFFAWPADTPENLAAGLRTLLAAWPPGAPMAAEPALASLDSRGRLRPMAGAPDQALLLPAASSAAGAALLALVAGAPCLLFAARAGRLSPPGPGSFVGRCFRRPGRIRLSPERVEVILPADRTDLDLRRAGLDRDPGWLPWLGRDLRFVFEGLDEMTDPRARVSGGSGRP